MKRLKARLDVFIASILALLFMVFALVKVPETWAQGPTVVFEKATLLEKNIPQRLHIRRSLLYDERIIPGAITPELLSDKLQHLTGSRQYALNRAASPVFRFTPPLSDNLQHLTSITDIVGATYDTRTRELIIIGIEDPSLPQFPPESILVGLRALLEHSETAYPCVSIDFGDNPDFQPVRYCGGIEDTRFGFSLFEADRLLKVYGLGIDNLTGEPITSQVPDYQSECELFADVTEFPEVTWRKWFSPLLHIKTTADGSAIAFSNTQMFLQWAYVEPPMQEYPPFERAEDQFVNHFNLHYYDFAEEQLQLNNPVLYELPQLAKLIGIGEWIRTRTDIRHIQGANQPWLNIQPIPFHDTPITTPVASCNTGLGSIRGGVTFFPDPEWYIPDDGSAAGITSTALATRRGDTWDFAFPDIRPTAPAPEPQAVLARGSITYRAVAFSFSLDVIQNGSFETGTLSPWQFEGRRHPLNNETMGHSGDWLAFLGGYDNAVDHLWQTITIPPDATLAQLTYYYAIGTEETTHPHDRLSVSLRDPATNEIFELETLSDADVTSAWTLSTFDVSQYVGRTLELHFHVSADGSNRTAFAIDDVSLDTNGQRNREFDIAMEAIPATAERQGLLTYNIPYRIIGNDQLVAGITITSPIPQDTEFESAIAFH